MSKFKNISELNRRIVIEKATKSRDAHGGEVKTWSTLRTCWAMVEPILTTEINENEDAKRLQSFSMTNFYIKYWDTAEITPEMRISYHSKYYDVEFVEEVGDFEFILIKTRKIK